MVEMIDHTNYNGRKSLLITFFGWTMPNVAQTKRKGVVDGVNKNNLRQYIKVDLSS